ncbi:MAG: HAD family hydrolase [Bacteroidota bacterium]
MKKDTMKLEGIRHLILDLGGVLFDIDYALTVKAFEKLGFERFDQWYSQQRQTRLFDDWEKGLLDESAFRTEIRSISGILLTDNEIDTAWNAMLIGFPEKSVALLKDLKESYSVHLLSNTNPLHEAGFRRMFKDAHPKLEFDEMYDGVFLSHRIGKRKPDAEVFEHVLNKAGIRREVSLFIDDSIQHVEGARSCGLHALWLQEQGETEKLLSEYGILDQRRS